MNTSNLCGPSNFIICSIRLSKGNILPILAENKNDLAARMKWQNGHRKVLHREYPAPQLLTHH